MNLFVTGGTGFVGRALISRLLELGHTVTTTSRRPTEARDLLGDSPRVIPAGDGDALREALIAADGVVNLAGEPLAGVRWTAARRRSLVESRVDRTRELVATIAALPAEARPGVLVSASAVGVYGTSETATFDEESPTGDDFLATLCAGWEAAALGAEAHGLRVVIPRIGVVLGPEGGALEKMLPPFRLGVGGRIASGRQWMSWIHLEDLVGLLTRALADEGMQGVFNATAPSPVTNQDFTRALGRALGRPTPFPVPGLALEAVFGESAMVLTEGQRVVPRRLSEHGFDFAHPEVDEALASLLGLERGPEITRVASRPEGLPEELPSPHYRLEHRTVLDAPVDEVFDFFTNARNLGLLTPAWTRFHFVGEVPEETVEGMTIDYRLSVGPVPLTWRTRIRHFEPIARMVDTQEKGPYRLWWHEHRFEARGGQTVMVDTVHYRMPFGPLGRLVHRFLVRQTLQRIFGYRTWTIGLRFGRGGEQPDSRRAA